MNSLIVVVALMCIAFAIYRPWEFALALKVCGIKRKVGYAMMGALFCTVLATAPSPAEAEEVPAESVVGSVERGLYSMKGVLPFGAVCAVGQVNLDIGSYNDTVVPCGVGVGINAWDRFKVTVTGTDIFNDKDGNSHGRSLRVGVFGSF